MSEPQFNHFLYRPTFCFEPDVFTYSPTNAFSLAQAARLAYRSSEDSSIDAEESAGPLEIGIESQVKRIWKFRNYHFLESKDKDTQGFIMGNDEIIVLVFRGTTSVLDWITNLDTKLTSACQGSVHRGFWNALNAVWDDVCKKLFAFRDNNQRVFVTGHSLGGALATLATARLLNDAITRDWVKGLYTFGSPRVGDTEFAAWFDRQFRENTFRFVNNCDIVTQVALKKSLAYKSEYDHVGLIKYFDSNGCLSDKILLWKYFKTSFRLQVKARMIWERLRGWGSASITALQEGQPLLNGSSIASTAALDETDIQLPWKDVVKYLLTKIDDHKMENYLQCLENTIQLKAMAPCPQSRPSLSRFHKGFGLVT